MGPLLSGIGRGCISSWRTCFFFPPSAKCQTVTAGIRQLSNRVWCDWSQRPLTFLLKCRVPQESVGEYQCRAWPTWSQRASASRRTSPAPGVCQCTRCDQSLPSCPILCDPVDCSPPGSSVHGILQVWILEWVAMSFSRGSSDLGIEPLFLMSSALAGRFFTTSATWEALNFNNENF